MDKRCAVMIRPAANGFIVEAAYRGVQTIRTLESAMVFDSVTRLADWLAVHFAREEQTMNRSQQAMADEQERLARAMRAVDGSKSGYSASWMDRGER